MQAFTKLWIYAIWATKNRQPFLKPEFRKSTYEHITKRTGQERAYLYRINGVADHVHCLIRIYPTHSVSTLLNIIKGESSNWINQQNFLRVHFEWQSGYSAFSVSESQVSSVMEYIMNQEEHHRRMTYLEEIEQLLDLHGVERA